MLSLSHDGGVLCVAGPRRVALVQIAQGKTFAIERESVVAGLAFSDQVWVFTRNGAECELQRYTAAGEPFGEPAAIPEEGSALVVRGAPLGSPAAVVSGRSAWEVRDDCGRLHVTEIGEGYDLIAPILGQVWIAHRDGAVWLRRPGRDVSLGIGRDLPAGWRLAEAHVLYDGNAALLDVRHADGCTFLVVDLRRGETRQRLRTGEVRAVRAVRKLGHALLQHDDHRMEIIDLRLGSSLQQWREPQPIVDVAVDGEGNHLVVLRRGRGDEPDAVVQGYRAVLKAGPQALPAASQKARQEQGATRPSPTYVSRVAAAILLGIESAAADEEIPAVPSLDRGALARLALPALQPRARFTPPAEEDVLGSLESCLELVAAWCGRAIATGWDSGRISLPAPTDLPFQREVEAILGARQGAAATLLVESAQRADQVERQHRQRWRGVPEGDAPTITPLALLSYEFGLTELATDILLVVAAPLLWGELARTYGILANDPARPLCDELLIGQILGPAHASRREIARELDPDRPLARYGLVDVGTSRRPFASLGVPDVVVARLWGRSLDVEAGDSAVTPHAADRSLADLRVPDALLASLVETLAQPPGATPLRLALRGRSGSGRRTLLAALASGAQRTLGLVDVPAMLGERRAPAQILQTRLRDAWLRGFLPCVSGTELIAADDPVAREQVREVFAAHPGPIAFRCLPSTAPPLDPGHVVFDLPALTEAERAEAWRESLVRVSLPGDYADDLAARYQLGPGTIERIARQVARGSDGEAPFDLGPRLETAVRQHRASRIGAAATRVDRLPSWSQVVLPDELVDSLREFVGRVRHRRTVYERWGFDRIVTSARGLTALFQGGPGTGKSMVAGVVARELGYELFRVDLARVLSKWIGETEKNLAAVFDAAEEGEVVLLFDEADALFTKRTEVRTSVDRYSNVETNYLLQRLDAFEGIAILTTNFGTAIDPAFKRRVSFRLSFPFPDDEMREKLWKVHLPPSLPVEGPLDFADLAKKYQLSGGYIRNATLRAAFLAAQEGRPVTHEHLERAVKLEYREMGKVIEGGVLE